MASNHASSALYCLNSRAAAGPNPTPGHPLRVLRRKKVGSQSSDCVEPGVLATREPSPRTREQPPPDAPARLLLVAAASHAPRPRRQVPRAWRSVPRGSSAPPCPCARTAPGRSRPPPADRSRPARTCRPSSPPVRLVGEQAHTRRATRTRAASAPWRARLATYHQPSASARAAPGRRSPAPRACQRRRAALMRPPCCPPMPTAGPTAARTRCVRRLVDAFSPTGG
jgi:hypothetical protein